MSNPPTFITGAGRSACPQEGAGNLSERFLAKQTHQRNENRFWRNKRTSATRTVSGETNAPAQREPFLAKQTHQRRYTNALPIQ
jgi:hypothetical protein